MEYRKSVFVVVYSKVSNNIEYLILKRKKHWKGWEFVKGGINLFETKINAAKREVIEETGLSPLKIKKFNFSGKYNYKKRLIDRPGNIGQIFSLYSARVRKGRIKLDKKEHNGFVWVDFKKAVKMLTWKDQKKSLKIVNKSLEKESHET